MAKVTSIVSPLPGVGIKVGSIAMRTTDPDFRVWEVDVYVGDEEYFLGEYRTGLSASVAYNSGHRDHLVWDALTIALTGDEQYPLIKALNASMPGSVETILDTCAIYEEEFYAKYGLDAAVDRAGLFDDRANYGITCWAW